MSTTGPTPRELRKFGFALSVGMFLGFFLIAPWLRGTPRPLWPVVASALILFTALAVPRLLQPLHFVATRVAAAVGAIQLRITLVLLFFGLWLPLGLALRLLRRDILKLRWDPNTESYREEPRRRPQDPFEKPF